MSVSASVSYIDISNNEPDSIQARINTKFITIPESVVEIVDNSFENSIIESIIFMGDSQLKTIGKSAFKNCRFLKSIQIPASVVEIADEAFFGSFLKEIVITHDSQLKIIGKAVFRNCRFLKSVTIPDSVTCIESNSFRNSAIKEVLFGDNSQCTTIGQCAFQDCRFLKSVKIPDSVVMIAEKAFSVCGEIEEVMFSANSKLKTVCKEAFLRCTSLSSFPFPQSLREIGSFAFAFCSLPRTVTLLSGSVEFLGDPFLESGVAEIIFGNSEKTQTTEKNNHFLQLCEEGDLSKCKEYIEQNHINLSYTKIKAPHLVDKIDDAVSIAMATENVDLIIFLIKNKVLMYSHCKVDDINEFFSDDDIFEDVFFESATIFWYSLCSLVMKKVYGLIRRLLRILKSKEYFEEWVDIFSNIHQIPPLQFVTQGDSLDFCQFLIDYDLIKFEDLEVRTIDMYFRLASRFGYVVILKKYLEILPIESISFKFTDFLMRAPQDKLYSMIEYTLPYLLKNEDPFGLVVKGEYLNHDYLQFPETVLSYLAYAQAFDAFKYIIENVPNTQYTPSHLVACSLFRGYKDAKEEWDVDVRDFMKLFEYILQDDVRPHVLGEDKEWVGKSIFTCIEYGSSEMCMKLFSYGFDKDDIYIDVISDDQYNSLIRYSLLSYACRYQSLEVVQFLIDIGVSVDGLLPNHINSHDDSSKNDQNRIDIAMEDDEIETERKSESENKSLQDDNDSDDSDDSDDNDDFEAHNDVTNPKNLVFENFDSIEDAWFEPYFNPYRLNKNQDVEIYHYESMPFDPSTEDPLERFKEHGPTEYLTLLNVTPLAAAMYAQNLDYVRLLLKNGANPNVNTLSGFPHLFVLSAGKGVINLDHEYSRRSPEVEYPVIDVPSDVKDQEVEQMEEQEKGKQMKMENKNEDEDEDVFVSIPVPEIELAIFQELVNYGADLFHDQTVRYISLYLESREFNIYDLCTHFNHPLDLLKYLQTIPQLCDKIKKYYIDSFHPTIVSHSSGRPLFSVDTVDYMFQNGYLHFETYKEDEEIQEALQLIVEHFQKDLKPVLEKYGFRFSDLANE